MPCLWRDPPLCCGPLRSLAWRMADATLRIAQGQRQCGRDPSFGSPKKHYGNILHNAPRDVGKFVSRNEWVSGLLLPSSLRAVAVARRSRRYYLRRRAGAPGAGSVVPPRSRRGAWPPLFRGGGLLSARCVVLGGSRFCVWSSAWSLPPQGRSPSRGAHGAAPRWRSWRRLSRASAPAAA